MIELGYYTVGRGMRNKQIHYRILGFNEKKSMEIWIQDYKNTGILLLTFDQPHCHTNKGLFCMWKDLNQSQVKDLLKDCEIVLSRKYKSLNWVIDEDKLNDLLVLDAI